MKRYPEYKESDAEFIRVFPSHWQMKRLKHVTESIKNGTTSLQVQSGKTDYPVTRIETISTGEINFDKVGHVNYWDGIENYRLRLGDILLSHINSLAILGNCAMLENSACLYHGMNLLRIRPNSLIDDRFLLYWLKSYPTNQLIKSFAKFAIGQVSISITNLKEIPISYPPLIEQTQIANFLDRKTGRIDELIRIKERRIELLQEQRTALINQAVTKGLDPDVEMKPSGVEWIGEIPKDREVTRLKYICESIVDCEHKTAPTQETGYPLIRTPNIGIGHLMLDGVNRVSEATYQAWSRRTIPQSGDLILAREAPVGNVAIIPKDLKVCLGQRTVLIRPDKNKVCSMFLVYLMLGDKIQAKFLGRSTGAIVHHLNMADIRNLELPRLPSFSTQRKIIDLLNRKTKQIDELITTEQRKIELLKEYRQSLISEAVTGKIDVRSEV